MAEPKTSPPNTEKPKYQVLEKCYLPVEGPGGIIERVLDPNAMPDMKGDDGEFTGEKVPLIITFHGVPAHYMKPMNAAAKRQCEKYPERMTHHDPINKLTIVGAPAPTA